MEQFYLHNTEVIKANRFLTALIRLYSKAITWVVGAAYVGFLVYLGFVDLVLMYRCVLVPMVGFIVVTVFRKMVNARRPYELYGFTPVINKDTAGKSFPSRHVFSIFVLAITFGQVSIAAFIFVMILGVLLALARVYGGVHFPKDVIAGALIGLLSGFIGYLLLGLL